MEGAVRVCSFIGLSRFLNFQNVVLILSNCDQKNGCPELVFELEN